jgi:hypothetical protein
MADIQDKSRTAQGTVQQNGLAYRTELRFAESTPEGATVPNGDFTGENGKQFVYGGAYVLLTPTQREELQADMDAMEVKALRLIAGV